MALCRKKCHCQGDKCSKYPTRAKFGSVAVARSSRVLTLPKWLRCKLEAAYLSMSKPAL